MVRGHLGAYPPEVQRIVYTTNAIESLRMQFRKIIKARGYFPTEDAAVRLIYLALRNITHEWKAAMNQFAILFPERLAALV